MKALLGVLLVAVAALVATGFAWLHAASPAALAPDGGRRALAELERTRAPERDVDLAARYDGRRELLDPRLALPTWHEHARDDAVRVHAATRTCPPAPIAPLDDPALAKAHAFHQATCAGAEPPAALVDAPPFLHPSGRSYAMLALAGPRGRSAAWVRAHARSFHVTELAALDRAALDADARALAALPPSAWEALARGDELVLTPTSLLIAARTAAGITHLRVYPRAAWEAIARRASVALRPMAPARACTRPASPHLCWEALSAVDRRAGLFLSAAMASGAAAAIAAVALGLSYAAERRRMHQDRVHVLRTLTHELRTPVTSLRLDIEPLRAAYDALPASCQEPMLRLSDGIERLSRVLHRTARYMALFEARGAARARLVHLAPQPSAGAMLADLAAEWPEGVTLSEGSADGPITTDPDWLGVAVRNLAENAVRHGVPPCVVRWRLDADALVIRVSDGGSSPGFSLSRSVEPHERDPLSPGLGLGLALVDRIAHLLGGSLAHEPSPTTFELRVPRDGGAS